MSMIVINLGSDDNTSMEFQSRFYQSYRLTPPGYPNLPYGLFIAIVSTGEKRPYSVLFYEKVRILSREKAYLRRFFVNFGDASIRELQTAPRKELQILLITLSSSASSDEEFRAIVLFDTGAQTASSWPRTGGRKTKTQ